jgi:hypothetical protein
MVGVLYLAGMVVGIGANVLIQSILAAPHQLATIAANSTLLALGVVFWLATVAGDAAHGVLMFPVLKRRSERCRRLPGRQGDRRDLHRRDGPVDRHPDPPGPRVR